jgi:proteic killer suppression protein
MTLYIQRNALQSFKDADTKELFEARSNRRWAAIKAVVLRKLDQLEASINLSDLRVPPGNRLEVVKGDRIGQHRIRINDQHRICFTWKDDGAHQVETTDYY